MNVDPLTNTQRCPFASSSAHGRAVVMPRQLSTARALQPQGRGAQGRDAQPARGKRHRRDWSEDVKKHPNRPNSSLKWVCARRGHFVACMCCVLLVRGDADWSHALAIILYGLAAASFLLGLIGLVWAGSEPRGLARRLADHCSLASARACQSRVRLCAACSNYVRPRLSPGTGYRLSPERASLAEDGGPRSR